MAKELPIKKKSKPAARRRRKNDLTDGQGWEAQGLLAGLNRQVGNRAVSRLMRHHEVTGEFSFRGLSPVQVRQAVVNGAVNMPAIQRQIEEAEDIAGVEEMDAGPAVQDTGEVTEEVVNEEYTVTGKTLAKATAGLDPEEWGRCRWKVDYDYETTGGKASKVNIKLKLTIRMPVWADYDQASPAAKKEWDRMIEKLRKHEDGHADIARKWAPIVKERMLGQKESKLSKAYTKVMKELDDESVKYDHDTNHGQNQGVSLDTSIP